MEMEPIYQKQFKIEISDVDFNKELRLSTLFSLFQDVASEAVDKLGIGINTLANNYGVAWVLIKMRVEVLRYPTWEEKIIIETWPREIKTLEFERDFLVYDQNNNLIIKASSIWIILDTNTRRIKRSNTLPARYIQMTKKALDNKFMKLRAFGDLHEAYKRMIGYSDIDFNGHLNNSKYIDFITDCFPLQNHQDFYVKAIEVNFINEALPGETLVLKKDVTNVNENTIYIEGETNNQTTFKAVVEIEKR
jgi:acyl-ACP thioesterase